MFVKPTSPDVKVPDPFRQGTPDYWLPAEGREVEPSAFWTRRILDKDVVEVVQATAAPAPATAKSAPPPAAAA